MNDESLQMQIHQGRWHFWDKGRSVCFESQQFGWLYLYNSEDICRTFGN